MARKPAVPRVVVVAAALDAILRERDGLPVEKLDRERVRRALVERRKVHANRPLAHDADVRTPRCPRIARDLRRARRQDQRLRSRLSVCGRRRKKHGRRQRDDWQRRCPTPCWRNTEMRLRPRGAWLPLDVLHSVPSVAVGHGRRRNECEPASPAWLAPARTRELLVRQSRCRGTVGPVDR